LTEERKLELEAFLATLRTETFLQFRAAEKVVASRGRAETMGGDDSCPADNLIEAERVQALSRKLDSIDLAILRLERGLYGYCLEPDCDTDNREISTNRLNAVPFATRCTTCEHLYEEAKKRKRKR
jgi:RNA polymerase-binding transcription factor DksA